MPNATFLHKHDMTWETPPARWEEAPFLGNGALGAMLWSEDGAMHVQLGHAGVYDHRDCANEEVLFYRCRLPIGRLVLDGRAPVAGCGLQLSLWDAELSGMLTLANDDRFCFSCAVLADEDLFVMRHDGQVSVRFVPEAAISPRQSYGLMHQQPFRVVDDYAPNPAPRFEVNEDVELCIQDLLCGGCTVTAWRQVKRAEGNLLLVTVCHSAHDHSARAAAVARLTVAPANYDALLRGHRAWWHAFYQTHELHIPDTRLERFYWTQMYKLGSATRPGGYIMDNQGPWLQPTPWPGTWWNLNVQLAYSPVFVANHLALFEPVWRTLRDNIDQLTANVPAPYRGDSAAIGTYSDGGLRSKVMEPGVDTKGLVEIGNLTWALHSCWLYYRMTMDDGFLGDVLLPLLERSVSYALHFLRKGKDGRLHLLPTASPEYGVVAPDTNYELGLLRWGLGALIEGHGRLGQAPTRLAEWRRILADLCDYPQDEATGFSIAGGVPYARSHRHASHLLMAYPLYLVNADQPGGREIIAKSLAHWQSKREALRGYSCTYAASIAASLGDGDLALMYLKGLWSGGFVLPNTLYAEDGPVIETPLSAATSIQEMLLQSWGGAIRVFPAMPSGWRDAEFQNLRAEGGFLVSAVRRAGCIHSIEVTSLAGEPCVLVAAIDEGNEGKFVLDGAATMERIGANKVQLYMEKGASARLIWMNGAAVQNLPKA